MLKLWFLVCMNTFLWVIYMFYLVGVDILGTLYYDLLTPLFPDLLQPSSRKHIVIIGHGFLGARLAQRLQSHFAVTTIDPKPHFDFFPSFPKLFRDSRLYPSLIMPIAKLGHRIHTIQDRVSDIGPSEVYTSRGTIHFDYCVIATGSSYRKFEPHFRYFGGEFHRDFSASTQPVCILGAGTVGVEIAGELMLHRQVYLVHSSERILPQHSTSTASKAKAYLLAHNVHILKVDRIANFNQLSFPGVPATAVMVNCLGSTPNSGVCGKHCVDHVGENQYIHTDPYLRLHNRPNIFCGGDVCERVTAKLAQNAERCADVIADNIMAQEAGKPLRRFENEQNPYIISLGDTYAILEWGNWSLGGFLPAVMKLGVEWKWRWCAMKC